MGSFLDSFEGLWERKTCTPFKTHQSQKKLEENQYQGIVFGKLLIQTFKMAKKAAAQEIERTYTIPLRKEFRKVPNWRQTKKAVKAVREYLQKHMKSEKVLLGKALNEKLWQHGIRNPPHKVKVSVSKDKEGVVKADLFGVKEAVPAKKKAKPVKKEAKAPAKKVEATESKKETPAVVESTPASEVKKE